MAQGLTQACRTKGQRCCHIPLGKAGALQSSSSSRWDLPTHMGFACCFLLLFTGSAAVAVLCTWSCGLGEKHQGSINRNILIASNLRKKSQALIQLPWKRATWIPVWTDFLHLGKCVRLVFFRAGYWSWQYIGEQLNSLTVASEGDQLHSCR